MTKRKTKKTNNDQLHKDTNDNGEGDNGRRIMEKQKEHDYKNASKETSGWKITQTRIQDFKILISPSALRLKEFSNWKEK